MVDRIGQKLGNYRITGSLGRGGFAEVYLAEHVYLKTQAAIKLLYTRLSFEEEMESFLKEAQTIAQLSHPHVIRVLDFGVDDQIPYLVMDYAVNGNLRQRFPKGTRLPQPNIVSYVQQIADALQYAHDKGYIHQDIKPENILLNQHNAALLSDFGLAKVKQHTASQKTEYVAGTAQYMSPEQFKGKPRPASDQYALAIMVYEWLCGEPPFTEGDFIQLGFQHTYVPVPSLSEKIATIAPDMNQVVMTALSKDAKQRFGSVKVFANALEQAAGMKQATGPIGRSSTPLRETATPVDQQARVTPVPPVPPTPVLPVLGKGEQVTQFESVQPVQRKPLPQSEPVRRATASGGKPITMRSMLPIIAASTLGTAIEWYDFFLYGFFSATIFAKFFFPGLDPVAGTIAAFTTNFVGFAARPIGGAFFGWFGDKVGRKSTLVATLLLMGIATALMGLLPGYASIGIAAPILLSLLRFLQGAGVGGEWGGSVLLSMEYGDERRRGFWASWPQTGVPVGLALSALAVVLFKGIFPGEAFNSIGWRFPFLLSALLIIVGLVIRLRILETPTFAKVKSEQRVAKVPIVDVFRYHWREIALSALLRSGEQAPFYIFTTFLLSYGVKALALSTNLLYTGIVVAAVVGFITIPTFGSLSDRVGRKRWFMIGVVLMAAFTFPYFLLLGTKNPVLVVLAIALSVGLCHAWLYGPEAALISERFGTKLRYSGASLGYQLASITAGGPAPIIATYLLANYKSLAPTLPPFSTIAFYMIGMCVISILAVVALREYTSKAAAADVDEVDATAFAATSD